jgi:glutaredoxin
VAAAVLLAAAWSILVVPREARATQLPASSCTICHANPDLFDEAAQAKVHNFESDVHAGVGLFCQDCHGGNPDPALAEDMDAAMDPDFAENPYVGAPARAGVPDFCGRCHSDPVFMKQYKPDARVDQETEYWTSKHGQALKTGDEKVAVCIDCHGVHGILSPGDPSSPVYPTQVAKTCSHCHADPQHMAGYKLPDGRPLPVDQYARWQRSVHANALLVREDLSAPTCNDCHGNHGATPPGIESVAFVCGQCHGREATLFRASPKHAGFQEHNEFLSDPETSSCGSCHDSPDPAASITDIHSFSECTSCHGNHAVVRPTVAILGPLPETPCAFCHESTGEALEAVPEPPQIWNTYVRTRDGLLAKAESQGLTGTDRFDWMVDQALHLPNHSLSGPGSPDSARTLRPEFQRLFQKFRIGKTHYTYTDPAVGKEVRADIIRCSHCHAAKPQLADEPVGLRTAGGFLNGMREVTSLTARAERILLLAERGGVEVHDALSELDQAVDDQIEMEVLVHTFSDEEGGPFQKKQVEAIQHANAALVAGQSGIHELSQRRTGLAVALILIVLVLVGLGFRIRQMSGRSSDASS